MSTTYLPDVDITTIKPHDGNARKDIGDVTDLAASIKALGVLEPLVVAPINGSGYRLIAGHRRLAAAIDAGLTTVPVLARADLDTEPKQLEAMLVENTQRVDLTPVEEAQAYAQLVAFPGYTPAKAAKATGRSVKTVKARLAIASLPKATLDKMLDGQISLADAQTLAEFAGGPHFKELSREIGGFNFKYAVQRVRDDEKAAKRLAQVREYCTAKGWAEVEEQPASTTRVLSSWDSRSEPVEELLDKLDAGVEYSLVVDVRARMSWDIFRPLTEQERTQRTTGGSSHADERRSKWQEQENARRKQLDDLEPAATVRAEFLKGRIEGLVLKASERQDLVRLLVVELLRGWDYDDTDLELAGVPDTDADLDDTAQREWLANATDNQLWKALVVLALRLGQNGDRWSPTSHVTPIRAAIALGYEPTDIELALIADASKDGAQ